MGEKGEGSGGEGGGNWGERGRELGMGYPLSTPSVSDFAVIGLKHWVLLHIDLSTMFFFTKSSNCFARMVRFGL